MGSVCGKGGLANIIIGTRRLDTLEEKFKYESLKRKDVIANGTFSTVHLARNSDNEPFVIRELPKEMLRQNFFELDQLDPLQKTQQKSKNTKGKVVKKLQTRSLLDHAYDEVKILQELSHTFIPKFFGAFETTNFMLVVTEFVPGGELFRIIHSHILTDPLQVIAVLDDVTIFYAINVALVIGYLHSQGIIHRDIRPENLLVDMSGYLKLVDYGFAKSMGKEESDKDKKTFTLCGNVEYMAPEVIVGKGYTMKVDWWAFGILIYEIYCGKSPFGDRDGDHLVTCRSIVEEDVVLNKQSTFADDLRKMFKRCLNRNPDRRRVSLTKVRKEICKMDRYKKLNQNGDYVTFDIIENRKCDVEDIPWRPWKDIESNKIEEVPEDEILDCYPREGREIKEKVVKKVQTKRKDDDGVDDEEEGGEDEDAEEDDEED